jgi:hypothetical protein
MAQQRMPQRPIPYNPRNYLRPGPKAKIIDLNSMMNTWGKNQAKYKEGDLFVSKKILQNLEAAESFAEVVGQDKFRKSLKKIVDIVSGTKGEISYMFEGAQGFLDETLLDQNYIHHYKENVWQYYQEKGKSAEEKTEKS